VGHFRSRWHDAVLMFQPDDHPSLGASHQVAATVLTASIESPPATLLPKLTHYPKAEAPWFLAPHPATSISLRRSGRRRPRSPREGKERRDPFPSASPSVKVATVLARRGSIGKGAATGTSGENCAGRTRRPRRTRGTETSRAMSLCVAPFMGSRDGQATVKDAFEGR
jgi:hypothetical protein